MPTQVLLKGWLFACVLLLLGTAFASAGEEHAWRHRLTGTWNNLSSGENIVIGRGQLGFWEAWASNGGEGRITGESEDGANITLASRHGTCSYYATLINANQLNMALRSGPDTCLKGVFVKVQPEPEVKHHEHVIVRHVYVTRHVWVKPRCCW